MRILSVPRVRGPNHRSRLCFAAIGGALSMRPTSCASTVPGPKTWPRRHSWPRCGHWSVLTTAVRSRLGFIGSVNRAIDWTRARNARREVTAVTLPDRGSELGDEAGRADELVVALGGLPPEHRAVIVMRYLQDLSPGEIATELGIPRGTVNSRLRRGLDKLSRQLDREQVR
jgi:Sigma-70, region 4